MSDWKELKKVIEKTLKEERETLDVWDKLSSEPDMYICQGWVEALNFVSKQMTFYENKNEEE